MIYSCNISCSKNSLKIVRNFIKSSLANYKVSELDVAAMVLAIDEVLANLIIHSHSCNIQDHIQLTIEVKKSKGVIFKIYDDVEFFNIDNYIAPSLDELVKSKRKGGMGLILVKKIMDKIEMGRESGKNYCRLYKKIAG